MLICESVSRIMKNKKKLEETLKVKIKNKGKEIIIEGKPEDECIAEEVIEALEFGFPFSVALLIKNKEYLFEIISIKDYTKRKNLKSIRARIIGRKGKTLKTIQDLTKCHFELKENRVGIIGDPEYIKNAQEAVISLIRGAKHSNVYKYLEKHQIKPILDLGLKK